MDSANLTPGVTYGAVLETHELSGGTYNNIAKTVVTGSGSSPAAPLPEGSGQPVSEGNLPPR